MATFLSSQDVGSLLNMRDYIETIENAYLQVGRGGVTMLPRINVDSSLVRGFLKILPGSLSKLGVTGIHIYSMGGNGTSQ
jgi:ornithine cyclodeaminase/alanine dehydrogenase-like protein (mu-crystallin family)